MGRRDGKVAVITGGGVAYVASKAAIVGMTKNIAMRCASVNVRCNALCPGSVNPLALFALPGSDIFAQPLLQDRI